MKHISMFLRASVLVIVAGSVLYAAAPAIRKEFMLEEHLVETLSAILFLAAFLLALALLFRRRLGADRRAVLSLALLSMFGFAEEMSYCGRLARFRVPAIYGHKFDGIHDIVDFIYRSCVLSFPAAPEFVILFLLAMFSFLLTAILAYRRELGAWLRRTWQSPPRALMLLTVTLWIGATVLDFDIVMLPFLAAFEELVELCAGMALVFSALAFDREIESGPAHT